MLLLWKIITLMFSGVQKEISGMKCVNERAAATLFHEHQWSVHVKTHILSWENICLIYALWVSSWNVYGSMYKQYSITLKVSNFCVNILHIYNTQISYIHEKKSLHIKLKFIFFFVHVSIFVSFIWMKIHLKTNYNILNNFCFWFFPRFYIRG